MTRSALYSEIAASDGLPQIFQLTSRLLQTPTAESPELADSERVRLLIEALERKDPRSDLDHMWNQADEDSMYGVFRLRRQIAASAIIARSHSIHCEQPRKLGYWIQEADDFEALTNLWTVCQPFIECEHKHETSIGGYGGDLPVAIVHAGKLPELKRIADEYLAPSDLLMQIANNDYIADSLRARVMIGGLGLYEGGGSKDDRYALKLYRLAVVLSVEQMKGDATQLTCMPSPELTYSLKEVIKRRHQK